MEIPRINLLPLKRLRAFRKQYFLRLATTGLVLATACVAIHSILLVPTYVYLKEQIVLRTARIQGLNEMRTPEQQELTAQVALFEENASRLKILDTTPAGSDVLKVILMTEHQGVTLSGFTFTPEQGTNGYRLLISGIATTRESLRQYDNALSALSFVRSVNLPIGSYAKEMNIPFTLTLTGTTP